MNTAQNATNQLTPLYTTSTGSVNFIQNLAKLSYVFNETNVLPTGNIGAAATGLYQEYLTVKPNNTQAQFLTDMTSFLNSFAATGTPPPTSYDTFINAFRKFFNITQFTQPEQGPSFTGFLNEFESILQYPPDWIELNAANINTLFTQSFNQFFSNYPYVTQGTSTTSNIPFGSFTDLLNNWRTFMSVTATLNQNSATGNYSNLLSYQSVYFAFNPNSTEADFTARLQKFFTDSLTRNQYFIPSQALKSWYDTIQAEYIGKNVTSTTKLNSNISSVTGTESPKAVILDQLFRLLVTLIGSIQQITATQANRLSYLTNFQRAYTTLMGQVPVFTQGDKSYLGLNNDDFANTRKDINPKNSIFTQNMQDFNSLIQDESKQLQSNVNQSNDAVNQQSSLANAIIQQFNTILQSIFR